MKTLVSWLSKYVDVPWSARELAERLTLAGLEVEELVELGAMPDGVIVAEILSRRPHPNADRLSLCEVRTGAESPPALVVCGAPNCDAGKKVPLATIGAVLPDGTRIKKAKLRGVESDGMLCSGRELGLSADHSGLIELPATAPVGLPLNQYLKPDSVIDWEVTPNRPDWLSHTGIAREIAAVAGCPEKFRLPAVALQETPAVRVQDAAEVEVHAPDLCPRYTARVIRNVRIGPSPDWLRRALDAVGVRAINNVVDITNYVMMECGQPLHAFDYERLAGHKIIVRRARDGETLTTLDGKAHRLTPANLLIADADRGVALAGVMGGGNSEIADTTTTVLLESAAFLPRNIRATAKQLGVMTESSYRFERGVCLDMVEFASARATALIAELAGGEVLAGVLDVYAQPYVPHRVRCRFARVRQLLGVGLDAARIIDCFTRLGLGCDPADADGVTVVIPSFRLDLEREVDLIEEVARIYGLENVPPRPAPATVGGPMAKDAYYPIEAVREQLLSLGLDEVMNYTLLGQKAACAGTGVTEPELVRLANPISAEAAYLRPSLLPGLLAVVSHNISRQNPDLALFEIGRVHLNRAGVAEERTQLGIAVTGRVHPERFGEEGKRCYDFYDLKGLLEGWFQARGLRGLVCVPGAHPAFEPAAQAEFRGGDQVVARFGEVASSLTADTRLTTPLFCALIEVEPLLQAPRAERRYQPLPAFPATARDISVLAPVDLPSQAILDAVAAQKCAWLDKVVLFDLFQDEQARHQGQRSLAYSFTYRHPDRTLTDEEVNREHERIKARLAEQLPIQFR